MQAIKNTVEQTLQKFPAVNIALRAWKLHQDNKGFPEKFETNDNEELRLLNLILENGYAVLPAYYSEEWCRACREAVDQTIASHPDLVKKREDERLFGSQNVCDELMAFHNDPKFSHIADLYYGQPAAVGVSMANRIGTLPGQTLGSGGDWHRDRLLRQFKTLVYLDDVAENDGPFQFIEGSHTRHVETFRIDSRLTGLPSPPTRLTDGDVQKLIQKKPDRLKTFTAEKGTVVLVDTSGIHRGMPVHGGKRYAVFNYYYPKSEMDPQKLAQKFGPLVPDNFSLNRTK